VIKFVPTPEQQMIIDRLVDVTIAQREDDLYFRMTASAPAGTGKTQLSAGFFKALEEANPEKKIGYFIFNSFMTDEIDRRAYAMQIGNVRVSTYHAFFADNIKNNEEIKTHFEAQYGTEAIDYSKTFYSKGEIAKSCNALFGSQEYPESAISLLRQAFNDWLNTDDTKQEFARNLASLLLENTSSEDPRIKGGYKEAVEDLYNLEVALGTAKGIIEYGKGNDGSTRELLEDFISEGMKHIMTTNKMTHSVYYKAVYEIAVAQEIDMFKDFDVVIVDEAQDMDKMFQRLLLSTPKPVLCIGDNDQSIYAFRGAVNTMEELRDIAEAYSLSYSFRYANDIAQLSNLVRLLNKEERPDVFVTGRYTPEITSITEELVDAKEMARQTSEKMDRMREKFDREYFVPNDLEEQWRDAKLSREDIKELADEVIAKEKAKMGKTATKDYEVARRKFIAQEVRQYRTAFICRNNATLIGTLFETLQEIDRLGDNKDLIQLSLTDTVSDEFTKIRNLKFPNRIKKAISNAVGEPYDKFVKPLTLDTFLEDYRVQNVLFNDKRYSFLLDTDKYNNFKWLLEQLSSRASGTISKSDKKSMLVFTTVHGSKGKEFPDVYIGGDILKDDGDEGISEEEVNIANVAITRAEKGLHFLKGDRDEGHPMWEFFQNVKPSIEGILSADYQYVYPFGVSLNIQKQSLQNGNDLYIHTFRTPDGGVDIFMQDEPIQTGRVQYIDRECLKSIIYHSKEQKKQITMRFDGEILNGKSNRSDEYFGVGKVSDEVILSKKKVVRGIEADYKAKACAPKPC